MNRLGTGQYARWCYPEFRIISKELPAFEVINLASELGFINNTGKMRLSQANELVQHYKGRDVEEDMPQNESDTVIRACIQYILGYDSSEITIEYGDFRSSLKNSAKMEMLDNSPYFYKKTTIRTLINLLSSTEGAEYETVSANFCSIVECVWDSLSSDDRYFIGITYSKYANKGNQTHILTFKRALERVHGFDYVPENLHLFKRQNTLKVFITHLIIFIMSPRQLRD